MSDTLAPCPFCKGKAFVEGSSLSASGWHVRCDDCGAQGQQFRSTNPSEDDQRIAEAVAAWSVRSIDDRMRAAIRAADHLSVCAQTSGVTAGRDEGLVAAIDRYAAARAALGEMA